MHDDATPASIGPYAIVGVLGGGGMGLVHRARAPNGDEVALKTIHPRAHPAHVVERFAREGRIRLDHPNVIRVLDAGEDRGLPYIVFELLHGHSLDVILQRGRLPPHQAVDLARQACRGLAVAHAAGIVHRDLKPSNLFLCDDGTLKVLDFGIARVEPTPQLTHEGAVIGTLAYLSPEQARGSPQIDARSDVWSLGAVLYEMLAGRVPFVRDSTIATLLAIVTETAAPVTRYAPRLSDELEALVARCLSRTPGARFADARALGEALATVIVERDDASGWIARSSVLPGAPGASATLRPDEERLVALVLCAGVTDAERIVGILSAARGVAMPLISGDVVALFGVESWDGDEIVRAVSAALACTAFASPISVSAGRARDEGGLVVGAALREAELAATSGLRGVIVHRNLLLSLGARFAVGATGGEFVNVSAELAAAEERERPLVGRGSELERARAFTRERLARKKACFVRIVGPPGIGKSRLLTALARHVEDDLGDGARVLRGRAERAHAGTSHATLAQLVRSRLGSTEGAPREALERMLAEPLGDKTLAADQVSFLGELLGITMPSSLQLEAARRDPQLMSDLLRIAGEDYLALLAGAGPVLVVLDDAQFADASSVSVLTGLARETECAMLVLVAGRDGAWTERFPEERYDLSLEGLHGPALRMLAEEILGESISEELLSSLDRRTAGNPFCVEHILCALRARGLQDRDQLPASITALAAAEARLHELPDEEREACKTASVIGGTFTEGDLLALGIAHPRETLHALAALRLLVVSPQAASGYRFEGDLIEEAAYQLLAPDARRALHRRAGLLLEARVGARAADVARHLDLGELPERAVTWYVRATAEASAVGDADGVLHASDRALALEVGVEHRFALHVARAEALRFAGRRADQAVELDAASRYAETDAERATALTEHVTWLARMGRAREAAALGDAAMRAADRSGDDGARALATLRRAEALLFAGRIDEAEALLLRASELADRAGPRSSGQVAELRARARAIRGDIGGARARYAEAAELFRASSDVRRAAGAEANLAETLLRTGDFPLAILALEKARHGCRKVGNALVEGYVLANEGSAKSALGAHAAALAALDAAEVLATRSRDARLTTYVRAYRARACLAAGDLATAVEQARLVAADDASPVAARLQALVVLGRAELRRGAADLALEATTSAMRILAQHDDIEEGEAEARVAHADVLDALGRSPEAERTRDEARAQVVRRRDCIDDPIVRERFVVGIDAHRRLLRGD